MRAKLARAEGLAKTVRRFEEDLPKMAITRPKCSGKQSPTTQSPADVYSVYSNDLVFPLIETSGLSLLPS